VRKGRRARSRTRSQRRNDRSWLGRSYFNPIPAALYCTPRHPQTLRREGGKRAQTSSTTPTLPGAAQTERRGIRMQLAPRLWSLPLPCTPSRLGSRQGISIDVYLLPCCCSSIVSQQVPILFLGAAFCIPIFFLYADLFIVCA
jgi:hypothetical protein